MQTAASRRLRKSAFSVLGLYFVVFLGTDFLVFRTHPAGWALWFFAALPAIPMLVVFALLGRYLREETDEYKRDMVVRCLLWGLGGVMSAVMLEGFLRIFEWSGHFPPFALLYVFVVFMLGAKLSYRWADRVPADA